MKSIRSAVLCILALVSVVGLSFAASKDPAAAPIPSQILSAKKIFIANGGSSVETAETISPDLPYDEFYAGMRSLGRFELLSSPADADLVFEIRFVTVPPTIYRGDGSRTRRQVELLLIDPHTRITLWTIYEQFDGAGMDSNKRKDLDGGIAALLGDLAKLTAAHAK
jgi:hypothetical protein